MSESILYKLKATVKFGDSTASLADVGTINGLSVKTENDMGQQSFDYREDTIDYIKKRVGKIAFSLSNINWENIKKFSDTDFFETVAGIEVPGAVQVLSDSEADTFYKIENQNGDKSLITVNSLGSLTEGADYFVMKDSNGDSGVVLTADQAGDLTMNYDYTPAAKKVYEYGGAKTVSTVVPKVIQVVGTDENNKTVTVTANYAKLTSGIELSFPAFSADEHVQIPVEFECTSDPEDTDKPVLKFESTM